MKINLNVFKQNRRRRVCLCLWSPWCRNQIAQLCLKKAFGNRQGKKSRNSTRNFCSKNNVLAQQVNFIKIVSHLWTLYLIFPTSVLGIIQIIYFCNRIVNFVTSASGSRPSGSGRTIEEFLVLMEYCPAVLSDLIRCRSRPFPPDTVARLFTQVQQIRLCFFSWISIIIITWKVETKGIIIVILATLFLVWRDEVILHYFT